MRLFIIYLLILLPAGLYAQETPDFNSIYNQGKTFMKEGKYGLAQDRFTELIGSVNEHPFREYASFFHAICSYDQGYKTQSKDMFLQILAKYPTWEKNDEVRHWLSVIFFEAGNSQRGIEEGMAIKNNDLKQLNRETQQYFIDKIQSADTLKQLFSLFPDNEIIAAKLVDTELLLLFSERDFALLETIGNRFPALQERMKMETPESEIKDQFTVSLLLPFALDRFTLDNRMKPNEFVYDLYKGVKMAVDSLNKSSQVINLQVYDTKRDTTIIKNILNQPELAQSDLIIGPLYHTELISEYSIRNKINILHPLSGNHDLLQAGSNFFLFKPREEDVIMRAVDYFKSKPELNKGILFYRSTAEDERLAVMFADSLLTDSTKQIKLVEVGMDDSGKILKTLTTGSVVNKLSETTNRIKGDDYNFVYVIAAEKAVSIYSDLITAVEARGDSLFVLGNTNWLEDNVISPHIFKKLNIHLEANEFINYTSDRYNEFSTNYLLRYGSTPGKFAAIGFESMYYFGRVMITYGNHFQNEFSKTEVVTEGELMGPKSYYRSNSNKFVPIFHWNGSKLELIK